MKKFGLVDKLAYMCGDIANDFSFIFVAMYLMIFYTKVLGVSGAVVGTLFLTARIVDAFTDIGMGRILDNMKPREGGKFRYVIRLVSPFICFSSFLLFVYVVKDFSYTAKLVYIFVTYLLWGSICYTAVNIPYGSMASVISEKSEDRASLSVFRTLGASISIFIISYVVPIFGFTTKIIDGEARQVIVPENFTIMAAIFSVVSFIFYFLCYTFTTERVTLENKKVENDKTIFQEVASIFSSLKSNKPLLIFIILAIILLLTTMLGQGLAPYLYIEYFANKEVLAYHGMIGTVITFMLSTFAALTVKKYGKQVSGAVGLLFGGALYAVLVLLKVESVYVFFALYTIATIGINFFNIIIWSFISDIIDDQEVNTGKREDGTIYAVYSFARKLGQALAGGLTGFALSAIGYVSTQDVNYKQTVEVKNAIYNLFTSASAAGFIICGLILLFLFPLTKKRVEKNTEELMRRRNKK